MSGGSRRFEVVRLPKDTAKMIDQLVDAAAAWGARVLLDGRYTSQRERELYTELCYARKWLSEHVELLCEEAGVEPSDDDQLIRYL